MENKRIGVVLSTDLKNSVIVNGETWDEVEELMPKARELYASLISEFGVKTYGNSKSGPGAASSANTTKAPRGNGGSQSISCADCGEPIKGKKDQKTGQFQSATEVAGWGQNKYGRPLCLNNVNGCYSKAGQSKPNATRNTGSRSRQQPEDELDF